VTSFRRKTLSLTSSLQKTRHYVYIREDVNDVVEVSYVTDKGRQITRHTVAYLRRVNKTVQKASMIEIPALFATN